MKRREFIATLAGAVALPLTARSQQLERIYRVGLLAPGQIGPGEERRKAIVQGLAARGFVEGRNLVLDFRVGDGRFERLSELAADLKASKADAIVTFSYPAALAAKNSAQGVPIVVLGSGDPVATGLAE